MINNTTEFRKWYRDYLRSAKVSDAFRKSLTVKVAIAAAFAAGRHTGRVETLEGDWP